ncbi:unnamed protein product [Moneuplotes crassus]|uniref:Uncharacterized protein n=1 Tax=Euplotes crassus TaxID=5936 RepID=A0AAD1Y8K9_EUPCR|nr:unnamed protein product [Moneuplotes crassus]
MNDSLQFDENLSEESLDENASVLAVTKSLNLAKNMSYSPFHFKLEDCERSKSKSTPIKLEVGKNSKEESKNIEVPTTRLPFVKSSKIKSSSWSNSKRKMKNLPLQKMKRMSIANHSIQDAHTKQRVRAEHHPEREITMKDLIAPKSFSGSLFS